MPQIAQQDYKVIAPKEGRGFSADAAALAELKKSILAGIGFDCLIKDALGGEDDINRVLGLYPDGNTVSYYNIGNTEIETVELPYTVTQYQGLAAVQNAVDETLGVMGAIPSFTMDNNYLLEDGEGVIVCVNSKYLTVTGDKTIEALAIAETGPTENFINISWEDAQKLIGLPLV